MADKVRNGGSWTEARFRQFVINGLRQTSSRWPPKDKVKKEARAERGMYWCRGYKRKRHKVPLTLPPPKGKTRRVTNVQVDHIKPVVDPKQGFVDWNTYIERLFVEINGLQILCKHCHDKKTSEERKKRR